jgi:hypothetical protein
MASKSQKFNASVNFGAEIDPSMTRTMNRLGAGINHLTAETEKLGKTQTAWQRELKSGSSSTLSQIKKVEQATQALISKQASLEKGIRDGIKNNKAGTSFLVEEYEKVGVMIGRARKELDALNKAQKREDRRKKNWDALTSPTKNAWARAKSAPGNMLTSGLSMVGGLPFAAARAAITAPIAIAKAGLGAGVGLIGGVIGLNHKTAEEYRQSQQYGMSFRHYKAGSILAEQAGLNGENFGDLSEELSNKLGDQGNDKTVNPMLWQLGIAGKSSLKGTKQQQYDQVMQAITSHIGKGPGKFSVTQASSLADQLMGGEANKLVTYIASTGKSYEEVMKNADQLNNISEDEARAAVESSQVISNLWTSGETALQGMAGELGKAFQPQMEAWEQQATAWISNNKKLVVNDITAWVDGGGPERVVHGLETLGRAVAQVVKWIDEILPDSRDPAEMDTAAKARSRGMALADEEASKRGIGWFDSDRWSLESQGADEAEQAWKDAHSRANVPDYVTFDPASLGGPIPALPTQANQQTSHQINQVKITVNAAPGQSPEELGQGIYQKFTDSLPGVPDFAGANTFDAPSL